VTVERTGLAAIAIYLCVLVVLTLIARRARMKTPSEFYLGGRGLPLFILFFTLYATTYSGNSLLGYPGEAYRRGFSWVMSTGFMMAIMVVFLLLAPALRRAGQQHHLVTPGDYIQLIAMGHVASGLTGGALPYAIGVVGLAAVILAYETLGGLRAVAFTDALQGTLLLVGLAVMLHWLIGKSGGLTGITEWILASRPALATVPSAEECRNWVSSLLLLGVGSVVYPQTIQRIYAAKTTRTLYRSFALMAWMPLATVFVVMLVGISALPLLSGLGEIGADEVMPRVIRLWSLEGGHAILLATLVFMGALAAIMSTADSVLLSLGSVITEDILGGDRYDPRTTRRGKWIGAGLLLGMVVIAIADHSLAAHRAEDGDPHAVRARLHPRCALAAGGFAGAPRGNPRRLRAGPLGDVERHAAPGGLPCRGDRTRPELPARRRSDVAAGPPRGDAGLGALRFPASERPFGTRRASAKSRLLAFWCVFLYLTRNRSRVASKSAPGSSDMPETSSLSGSRSTKRVLVRMPPRGQRVLRRI
jgi:SSS family solute:Na+ symporter/sodium/pantothenate symporter